MNRSPAALTKMQPGRLRSARQNTGPPVSGIDGPHQASSIRSSTPPAASPGGMPSPVLPGEPTVHSAPIGARWYRARISALRLETAGRQRARRCRARISDATPSLGHRTPVTRPSSICRPVIGCVQPRPARPPAPARRRKPAVSAWPMLSSLALAQLADDHPAGHPGRGARCARMRGTQAHPAVVRLRDGDPGGPGRYGGRSRASSRPEDPAVDRQPARPTAAAGLAAGRLGVVVGVVRHPLEPHRRVRQHQVEHGRAVLQEAERRLSRRPPRRRRAPGRRSRLRGVGAARPAQHGIARDPRHRRRTGPWNRRSTRSSPARRRSGRAKPRSAPPSAQPPHCPRRRSRTRDRRQPSDLPVRPPTPSIVEHVPVLARVSPGLGPRAAAVPRPRGWPCARPGIRLTSGHMSDSLATEPTRRLLTPRQANTVHRLTKAGVREIGQSGYENLSIRDVARRAGVAPATAYTYFASKDHLLTEIFWRRLNVAAGSRGQTSGQGPRPDRGRARELALLGVRRTRAPAGCTAPRCSAASLTCVSCGSISGWGSMSGSRPRPGRAPRPPGCSSSPISAPWSKRGLGYTTFERMADRLAEAVELIMR